MLFALNYFSVLLYGLLIMVFLLDIEKSKRSVLGIAFCFTVCLSVQLLFLTFCGAELLEKAYPLIVHLPLFIFFVVFFRKRADRVLFVLCTAYILSTPRRWLGDLVAPFFHSDPAVAAITSMIVSIPLLFITYTYIRPHIIKMLDLSQGRLNPISIVPLVYYILANLTTVYTTLLYTSKVIVIGILTTGLILVFYYFLITYLEQLTKRLQLQKEQDILAIQISSLQRRTETMKLAEEKTILYRHDMRHHLNLIAAYLRADNKAAAEKYIAQVGHAIEDTVVRKYCANYTVDLILGSYISAALNETITVDTTLDLPEGGPIPDMDLCVIFANTIENATNACKKVENPDDRHMQILCKRKEGKLYIQLSNTYSGEITFVDGKPVRSRDHHGLGVNSIVTVVEKHGGLYSFTASHGTFTANIIV